MARKVITLEIDADDEGLIRGYADFVAEMKDLAATAPDGSVLDICEDAVIERGREQHRRLLQRAAQARIDDAEKKSAAEAMFMRPGPRESRRRLA